MGTQKIERVLRDYRDAIQFVHDQAIRGMNMGMTPDELAEHVKLPPHLAQAPSLLHGFPLKSYFDSMAVNLNPEACTDLNKRVGMVFPDAGEAFSIHVRHGVAEIRARTPEQVDRMEFDIKVIADSRAWKEMLGKVRSPLLTLAGFQYEKGNALSFAKFLKIFEPTEQKLPYEPLRNGQRH